MVNILPMMRRVPKLVNVRETEKARERMGGRQGGREGGRE